MITRNHFGTTRTLTVSALLWLGILFNMSAAEPLKVVVSIPPLQQIVERVGGDAVEVQFLLKPGSDPHSFEPTAKQVGELAGADLFVEIGLPFEKQVVDKVRSMKSKGLVMVDAAAGVTRQKFGDTELETEAEEDHGHNHSHDHDDHAHDAHDHGPGAMDPHIWLDTKAIIQIAENIERALATHPAWSDRDAAILQKNLAELKTDLEKVAAENAELLAPYKGKMLFVYHPAFGYFARENGLQQWAIEASGKTPSVRQISRIVELAKAQNARVIFVQPQFSPESGKLIAERINGKVRPMDPLAEDLLGNLKIMAQTVADAYNESSD